MITFLGKERKANKIEQVYTFGGTNPALLNHQWLVNAFGRCNRHNTLSMS